LPKTSGNALGIDRLEMLLLDVKDINDLLTFPVKKCLGNNKIITWFLLQSLKRNGFKN